MRWVQFLAASVMVTMAALLLVLVILTPLQDDRVFAWSLTGVLGLAYLVTGVLLFWQNADAVPAGGILSMLGAALAMLGMLTRDTPLMFLLLVLNVVAAASCLLIYSQGMFTIHRKH